MRVVSTDLNILIRPEEWNRALTSMPDGLKKAGYNVSEIHAQPVDLTCEPDNMLVTHFAQTEGYPPSWRCSTGWWSTVNPTLISRI